jgi:hypothetical protein
VNTDCVYRLTDDGRRIVGRNSRDELEPDAKKATGFTLHQDDVPIHGGMGERGEPNNGHGR